MKSRAAQTLLVDGNLGLALNCVRNHGTSATVSSRIARYDRHDCRASRSTIKINREVRLAIMLASLQVEPSRLRLLDHIRDVIPPRQPGCLKKLGWDEKSCGNLELAKNRNRAIEVVAIAVVEGHKRGRFLPQPAMLYSGNKLVEGQDAKAALEPLDLARNDSGVAEMTGS